MTTETTPVIPSVVPLFAELEQFLDIVRKSNCVARHQSGFIRIDGPAGRRLYIANTKTVRRVDLSGFEMDLHTVLPKNGPFGNVKQQMSFDGDVDSQLARFELVLQHMLSLPAIEKKVKAPVEKKVSEESKAKNAPADTTVWEVVESLKPSNRKTRREAKKLAELAAPAQASEGESFAIDYES